LQPHIGEPQDARWATPAELAGPRLHAALAYCGTSLGTDRDDIRGQRLIEVVTWCLAVPSAHVLLDAVRRLANDTYELQIHGDEKVFPDYVADLRRRAEGMPVRFMGRFDQAQAMAVYGGLDVLVVPSVWLENSPLVIHEAFQAGVPVVGSRIGGTADLVTDGVNGRLYDPASPADLAAILSSLVDNPEQLAAWAVALPPVRTVEDDARGWERTYEEVIAD